MLLGIREKKIGQSGLTVIEVIVALAILAIAVLTIAPMMVMALKNVSHNRSKLVARSIATQYLEEMQADTTAQNYATIEAGKIYGPAKAGDGSWIEFGAAGDGNPVVKDGVPFTVRKIVNWVDDPSDGEALSGTDLQPNDYKLYTVEVTSPGVFSGKESTYAELKSYVAREGEGDPVSAMVVEVKQPWTDQNVAGADVTVTEILDNGVEIPHSGVSNPDGLYILDINKEHFNTQENLNCRVTVSMTESGQEWMMKPVIIGGYNQNYETVVASKYKTITKTIEFDRAATLEIHFNGLQKDGSTVTITNESTLDNDYVKIRTLNGDGQPDTVIFEHLWAAPDTSYAIEADLLAWSEDFNTFTIPLGGFETWKGVESESGVVYRNLWAEDVQCWSALYTEPTPVLQWHAEEEAQSLLSPVIDLSRFAVAAPLDFNYKSGENNGLILVWNQYLAALPVNPAAHTFLSRSKDGAAGEGSGSWYAAVQYSDITPGPMHKHTLKLLTEAAPSGEPSDLSSLFRLRFSAVPEAGFATSIDDLAIYCQLNNPNLTFTSSGEKRIINATQ